MCLSPIARPSRVVSRLQCAVALLSIVIVFATTATALAQRQPARGAASRETAPSRERGGYGGVGSATTGNTTGNAAARKGDDAFPARTAVAAGAATAEYQKPTYEHYRLAPSPDGTMIALSGSHIEKENAGKKEEKAKRDKAGKFIVTENVVEVIDVATGRSLVAFKPPMLFDNLALSPDNRFLAVETAARPGIVNVLHLPTRKPKEFKTELKRVVLGGLAFSNDGRSINVLAPDRLLTIAIANGETKEVKFEITSPAASFNAAGNLIAVGVSRSKQGGPEVQIYDVATGKQTEELDVPSAPSRVQFSADGKWLAATIAGGALVVWQTSDWTATSRAASRLGFDPDQLTVSLDGARVAVRPRGTGPQESKVIDVTSGEVSSSVRTRDLYFLPTGALAVSNNRGPFYMDAASGDIAELPAGGAAAALAQASAPQPGFADNVSQPPAAAGYRAIAPPANSQPGYGVVASPPDDRTGYGAVSQPGDSKAGSGAVTAEPANSQPGYGAVTSPAADSRAGYGVVTPPPTSTNTGYGAVTPPPTNPNASYGAVQPTQAADESGRSGQANTVESQVFKDELTKVFEERQKALSSAAKSPAKESDSKAGAASMVQDVQRKWPRVLQVSTEDEQRFREGKFSDEKAKERVESALRMIEESDIAMPALQVLLLRQFHQGKPAGARLELTARLLEALDPAQTAASTNPPAQPEQPAASANYGYGGVTTPAAPGADGRR